MKTHRNVFQRIDPCITSFMARYSIRILRFSLGVVFFWFGVLKFFPGMSPAQELAGATIERLSHSLIAPHTSVPILAACEVVIGLGLITGWLLRATLFLLFAQMLGAMTPLILFPAETFTHFPYAPTLEGQYIIKNLVLIGAGLVVGSTVRGGHIVEQVSRNRSEQPPRPGRTAG